MKRSVIQLAGRTLLVSLPAKWAAANNVKKGDEIDITEDGNRLTVSTEAKTAVETAEINADSLKKIIKRYIYALYKKGIDEIKVNYSDPKIADTIRDTLLNETVGYEIVSQTTKSCTIKLITSGEIIEFDNLLRRIFLLLLSMSDETLQAVKNKDFDHLLQVAQLEQPNNRLTTVCRRSLNKFGVDTYKKLGPIYFIVEEVENIADEYKRLCVHLNELKLKNPSINPEVIGILEKTNSALRSFYDLMYKHDLSKLDEVEELRKKVMSESHRLIQTKKLHVHEFYILHYSMIITQEIFEMTGPYLVLFS